MVLASFIKNDKQYRIKSAYTSGPYRLDQLVVVDPEGKSYKILDQKGQYRIMDRSEGKQTNTTVPKAIVNMLLGG